MLHNLYNLKSRANDFKYSIPSILARRIAIDATFGLSFLLHFSKWRAILKIVEETLGRGWSSRHFENRRGVGPGGEVVHALCLLLSLRSSGQLQGKRDRKV